MIDVSTEVLFACDQSICYIETELEISTLIDSYTYFKSSTISVSSRHFLGDLEYR